MRVQYGLNLIGGQNPKYKQVLTTLVSVILRPILLTNLRREEGDLGKDSFSNQTQYNKNLASLYSVFFHLSAFQICFQYISLLRFNVV